MNLNDLSKGNPRPARTLPKAGIVAGRLLHIVDLGVQEQKPYQGEPRPPARTIWFNFELPNDKVEIDGEMVPQRISTRDMRASNDPKSALFKLVNGLDPNNNFNGDLGKFIGMPCLVTVIHAKVNREGNIEVYANFGGATPPPDGFPIPEMSSKGVLFDFNNPNIDDFFELPKFIQDKILKAVNLKGSKMGELIPEIESRQVKPAY